MAISGRFVALVAFGAVPLVVFGAADAMSAPAWGGAWALLGGWLVLCVALGLIDLAIAASPRHVLVERALPDRVRLGEPVTSRLYVTNRGQRRMRAVVRDAWQPSAGVRGPNRTRVTIPPGERRVVELVLVPWRRGDRRVQHVTIRSSGPLRLWSRQASLDAPGRLRVLPPFHSRRHLPSRLDRLRELEGRTPVMTRGPGTEFDSLRSYVRGDDVRSIDWRATARRDEVVVRTWRPERDRRVVILVDTGRSAAARIGNEPRIDTAFETSLLLAALASRAGDRVDFLAWDRRVRGRVQGSSGAELLTRLVDTMAPIEAELIEADWRGMPALVRDVTAHHAFVVVLTAIDSVGSSRGLLSVLPQLTRHHSVLVAAATDPDIADAIADRSDSDATYRAAAAERAMLDVARVSAAVRRLGAHVVTAAPLDLPPAVADTYLALKASGRL